MTNLIKPITSDHDLIELADKIGIHIDQILTLPEIKSPLPTRGTFIILLRSDGGVGHWVAVHDGQYWDPMGVGPPTAIGNLKYNEIQFQSTYGFYCGPWCMLWLYCKQKDKMDLLARFQDLDVDAID